MKKLPLYILLLSAFESSYSQITNVENDIRIERKDSLDGWRKGFAAGLYGSNVGFSNWAAGGINAISANSSLGFYANLKTGPTTWDNDLDIGYGVVKQGDSDWIKADDRFEITSKFGRRASKRWYYAALQNFRTQLTSGYNYPNDSVVISGFLAPAYNLVAVGMDYKIDKKFSMFIAPLTAKLTFVNDQTLANAGSYGVAAALYENITNILLSPGKRFRAELGGYFRSQLNLAVSSNIKISTSLDLFSNYIESPQNIDVNWQSSIEVKLWKFLTLTFMTHLIYDDDVNVAIYDDSGMQTGLGPRVQFKHLSGIGLSWKVNRSPEVLKKDEDKQG
ncbi:DUF3078 domain-containing protein [Crocinitomix catalasitica]|nr:DUF3078 domain-containing protein [Crocinitomix catalasitica]